jgi:GNAT superfamily N-acetyltransferase
MIVGLLTLTESQSIYAGGNYGTIDEMYLLPDSRDRKIGRQFLEFIFSIAREKQWQRIDVTAPTEAKWQKTIDFYESNGFQFTGPKLKKKLNAY